MENSFCVQEPKKETEEMLRTSEQEMIKVSKRVMLLLRVT